MRSIKMSLQICLRSRPLSWIHQIKSLIQHIKMTLDLQTMMSKKNKQGPAK